MSSWRYCGAKDIASILSRFNPVARHDARKPQFVIVRLDGDPVQFERVGSRSIHAGVSGYGSRKPFSPHHVHDLRSKIRRGSVGIAEVPDFHTGFLFDPELRSADFGLKLLDGREAREDGMRAGVRAEFDSIFR